jgi:hypothetical protein
MLVKTGWKQNKSCLLLEQAIAKALIFFPLITSTRFILQLAA